MYVVFAFVVGAAGGVVVHPVETPSCCICGPIGAPTGHWGLRAEPTHCRASSISVPVQVCGTHPFARRVIGARTVDGLRPWCSVLASFVPPARVLLYEFVRQRVCAFTASFGRRCTGTGLC